MKTKLWHHVLGGVFAFWFAVSAAGTLATGWDLPVSSMLRLYIMCGVFAMAAAAGWYFRYGGWGNLAIAGIVIWRLWQDGALWEQMQSLANVSSSHFMQVYGWPTIGKDSADTYDLVLLLVGCVAALLVTYCICRQKTVWIAVPFIFAPLILSLMTTDTLPDTVFLFMMLLGGAVLLVTEWVRLYNPEEYSVLVLWSTVPTALALVLLLALNPQSAYENHAAELQKKAVSFFQQVQNTAVEVVETGLTGNFSVQKLNLRHVGPKNDISYPALKVTSPYTGTVYLRGRDYDVYTGMTWETSEKRTETFPAGLEPVGTLTVSTYRVRDVLYTPYYAAETVKLKDGCRENTDNVKTYSYLVSRESESCEVPSAAYTTLPAAAEKWAGELVRQIADVSSGQGDIVQQIAAYVRGSASYDLSTPSMDSAYEDFARWFLKESNTGYCVHFATAAAVLLRAAGIPARYVEGYAALCSAGENTLVSSTQAHAWVEYYDTGLAAWQILEATPAGVITAGEAIPEDTEADGTETSATPPETEDPAETAPNTETAGNPDTAGNSQGNSANVSPYVAGGTPSGSGNEGAAGSHSSGNGGSDDDPAPDESFILPEWLGKLLGVLFFGGLFLSLIPLQAKIRAGIAWKQWNAGEPNTMAITRWKQLQRMAGHMKTDLPDELNRLALKAGFSQHTLTPEELAEFDAFRKKIIAEADNMPFLKKYRMRWIYAIINFRDQ